MATTHPAEMGSDGATDASGDTAVRRFLETYRGKRIFHPPLVNDTGELVGNNGDLLMVLGTERVYRDLEIERIDRGEDADLIVIGASGGMLDKFRWITGIFRDCSHRFPDTPLCVLPSTYYYPTKPFAEEVGERAAPVTLFCREPYSAEHLRNDHDLPPCCEVVLDPDMAFEMVNGEIVSSLRGMERRHVLVVERVDVEHTSVAMRSERIKTRKWISKVLPKPVKTALYPLVTAIRSRRHTPFRAHCEALLKEHHPGALRLPREVKDVSNVNTCTFERFCGAVGGAEVVFTTRLHVGILASMVGVPTFIFEGPYHKIRGIYEYSLVDMDHVRFVEWDGN